MRTSGALRQTLRRLQAGGILAMAPEGTRSKSGNLIEAKPGGIFLAWKAGVPILPVAVTGTEDAVVRDRLKHFRRLDIQVRARGALHLAAGEGEGPAGAHAGIHRRGHVPYRRPPPAGPARFLCGPSPLEGNPGNRNGIVIERARVQASGSFYYFLIFFLLFVLLRVNS